MKQEIEIQIWEYIDGICDDTTKEYVQHKIATDAEWKSLYRELLAQNASMPAYEELDQPSMRFTKNVMEAVGQAKIAPATRRYINPIVIRLISGFFILSVALVVIYALTATGSTTEATPVFNFDKLFSSDVFNMLVWLNVVMALLFVDTLLRFRSEKHSHR